MDTAPTSMEPEGEERKEPYFDSLEDPVNYWDESWYFCIVLVHCRKLRLEQRKQRFFENIGEYLSILDMNSLEPRWMNRFSLQKMPVIICIPL